MKNFKTIFLMSLFLFLIILISYHWIFPENGKYEYEDENGDLIAWVGPFQPCIIYVKTNSETFESTTPVFGVDRRHADLAFRISVALWTNIWLAFIAATVFVILAIISGILIGYDQSHLPPIKHRNTFDNIKRLRKVKLGKLFTQLLVETLHAIPMLLLLLVVVIISFRLFDDNIIRMLVMMIAIGVLSIPKLALLIRDRIEALVDEEFINAAKASGLSDTKIIFTHILWYECSPIIAGQFIYVIVQAIMLEAVISFLGFGGGTSLGGLIYQFKDSLPGPGNSGSPLALMPLFILLLVAIVGNGCAKLFMELRHE
ncbi:MAG: ABC transporter permease subunit [Candidatus Marinimicrobia bacterium]|nr:ABC transporter permease subunit [Candidatus Neomarinimicrobiota bacterium]MBL7109342.1 ABC transporter permease subunit [Candidatus Neomarinimicrobiota bacterium]